MKSGVVRERYNNQVTKECHKCEIEKSLDGFYLRNDTGKLRGLCKECLHRQNALYRKLHKALLSRKKLIWQKNNPDKRRKASKRYYSTHKEEIKEYTRTYKREKRTLDQRIKDNLRKRIWMALKGQRKASNGTLSLVG